MFSILRAFLIIGAIFYYSPVRQQTDGATALDGLMAWGTQRTEPKASAPGAGETPAHLETMWQALPDGAKQAVIDKILATSGLGPTATPAAPAGDTLRPSDRQPPWRGEAKKSNS
ncbi:hypothetical protein [Microvirga puerhi]|uniref:Uncharacterized protein n=1 Tax=Microvirga puerhi TaxID=2876078 RepID=A0ABS7VMX3_9HYPH|nr:hypothetical protein [Microvirga puerhi]MBZ6076372.1 hypothetical protein [Microvirga puerhi]